MLNFTMNMPYSYMVLYGSIMIVLVLILRLLLKKRLPSYVFCVLWMLILLRFLVPFSISSPISAPIPNGSYPFLTTSNITIQEEIVTESLSTEVKLPTNQGGEVKEAKEIDDSQDIEVLEGTESVYTEMSAVEWTGEYRTDWRVVFSILFVCGILITVLVLGIQKWKYSSKLKNSYLVEQNSFITEALKAMNMGHVLIYTADEIVSPMVSGIFQPRIYLPTSLDFQNKKLLLHIISHELIHIKKQDNAVKMILLLTLCINWYNPLVWIMSKCMAADLETACDELVLRNMNSEERQSYAYSLLAMAINKTQSPLLYSAFSKTEVERRITRVVNYKRRTIFTILVSVLFLFSSTVVCATGGQAPFNDSFSSTCGTSNGRWVAKVYQTRNINPGNATREDIDGIVIAILSSNADDDYKQIQSKIVDNLANRFKVEKSAFQVNIFLSMDREAVLEEYAKWGITEAEDGTYRYKEQIIHVFWDEMLSSVQTRPQGDVDINVVRDLKGNISSIDVFKKGDKEFEEGWLNKRFL